MLVFLQNKFQHILVQFSSSSLKQTVFLLRSQRLFVKNKYARNRQWSKNIIYFGVLMNIVFLYGVTLYCYHYTMNLSYTYILIVSVFCYYWFVSYISGAVGAPTSFYKLVILGCNHASQLAVSFYVFLLVGNKLIK